MSEKLKAKKSLGQNFLRSGKAISDIVNSVKNEHILELLSEEIEVIEIGGGEGVVTGELLKKGYAVNVVELDIRAIEKISEDYKSYIESGKLKLYHKDVLETDFSEIISNSKSKKYIVIGNIPYYITGLIFRHIFEQKILPIQVTLMVQKEVADRICHNDNKESIMSLSLKVYGKIRRICTVKRGSFSPAPKVDSAVFTIENIKNPFQTKLEEDLFFTLVKTAFRHPRKIALSNLKSYLEKSESISEINLYKKAEKYFVENNLEKKRPEDVKLEQWLEITIHNL